MKVVFTERAFVSVLAETAEKITTETGGIFLGYRCGETWYVMESIDPGPKSVFEVAYFEYDQRYVNHLSRKVARLYKKPLELLGLWHRHPGSFDQFSGTDDGTNKKFAAQNPDGAISALVNIDPTFRLTVFHVEKPLRYEKVSYSVGDSLLPKELCGYCDTQRLMDYLSAKEDSIWGQSRPALPAYKYDDILNDILKNLSCLDVTDAVKAETIREMTDENLSFVLSQIENDINFFGYCGLDCQMVLQDKYVRLILRDGIRVVLEFCVVGDEGKCMFDFRTRLYRYIPSMFETIISDVIEAKQRKRIFFSLNKEFVECSIQKLEKY